MNFITFIIISWFTEKTPKTNKCLKKLQLTSFNDSTVPIQFLLEMYQSIMCFRLCQCVFKLILPNLLYLTEIFCSVWGRKIDDWLETTATIHADFNYSQQGGAHGIKETKQAGIRFRQSRPLCFILPCHSC